MKDTDVTRDVQFAGAYWKTKCFQSNSILAELSCPDFLFSQRLWLQARCLLSQVRLWEKSLAGCQQSTLDIDAMIALMHGDLILSHLMHWNGLLPDDQL